MYKSGNFDKCLLKILENYENIMKIILPTLRKERGKVILLFLPICKKTGKVLEVPIKIVNKEKELLLIKMIINSLKLQLQMAIVNCNGKLIGQCVGLP